MIVYSQFSLGYALLRQGTLGGEADMQIVDLRADDEAAIQQIAALLVEGFATNWPEAWPDLDSAVEEVRESFAAGRISRLARDEDGTVLGWVGGISQYGG